MGENHWPISGQFDLEGSADHNNKNQYVQIPSLPWALFLKNSVMTFFECFISRMSINYIGTSSKFGLHMLWSGETFFACERLVLHDFSTVISAIDAFWCSVKTREIYAWWGCYGESGENPVLHNLCCTVLYLQRYCHAMQSTVHVNNLVRFFSWSLRWDRGTQNFPFIRT